MLKNHENLVQSLSWIIDNLQSDPNLKNDIPKISMIKREIESCSQILSGILDTNDELEVDTSEIDLSKAEACLNYLRSCINSLLRITDAITSYKATSYESNPLHMLCESIKKRCRMALNDYLKIYMAIDQQHNNPVIVRRIKRKIDKITDTLRKFF